MVRVFFFRCLFGWHIVLQHKTGKKKQEYLIRIWKPVKRQPNSIAILGSMLGRNGEYRDEPR